MVAARGEYAFENAARAVAADRSVGTSGDAGGLATLPIAALEGAAEGRTRVWRGRVRPASGRNSGMLSPAATLSERPASQSSRSIDPAPTSPPRRIAL